MSFAPQIKILATYMRGGTSKGVRHIDGQWVVTKALMSRSARVLMEGWVAVPG
jgi:2-methylaconitate cis-trans-isomerase PrpF